MFHVFNTSQGPAGCRAADAEEKDVPADADAAWIKIRAGAEFRHLLGIVVGI